MVVKSSLEKESEKNQAVGSLLPGCLTINQHKENQLVRPLLPEPLVIINVKIIKLQE